MYLQYEKGKLGELERAKLIRWRGGVAAQFPEASKQDATSVPETARLLDFDVDEDDQRKST